MKNELSDNGLYALIWILVAALACAALFKGCESVNRSDELNAIKTEAAQNAASFAQSDCTRKGGTMYGDQCVICGTK